MKLKPEISIGSRLISDREPVYIIAEMACAHQGDKAKALSLVDAAVSAGADCIQIQIFDPASNMVPTSPLYSVLENLYFSPVEWREIKDYIRQFDIHLSVFAYDEPSLELAIDLEPDLLKLNSSELSNPPMLIGAAGSSLPFTLGTGASSLEEIRQAVECVLNHGGEDLILMHGVQNFPTDVEAANIRKIQHLKDAFGCVVIYADHTSADLEFAKWLDLLAIGHGAAMLEKHIILDRSAEGVDWQAALEPEEFKCYVRGMRQAWRALGSYDFQAFTTGELKYRQFQKKCIVAARDLEAGDLVERDDVVFLRVQGEKAGLPPKDFESAVLGRKLNKCIAKYEQILPSDLSER